MKRLLLTFDVEEFDLPVELLGWDVHESVQLSISHRGMLRVLPLLAQRRAWATFFVTGTFARAHPSVVRRIAADGHEVAVHGLSHADDYDSLEAREAVRRLREAREVVEQAAGTRVTGVRTPRLRFLPAKLLSEAGFRYDASIHPTWVPGRYNGLHWPRTPWWDDELLRVPISVLPVVRLPVAWIWYRLAGHRLGWWAFRAAAARAPYLHLYFHPWEAENLRRLGLPRWLAVRTGERFLESLEGVLAAASGRFRCTTIHELVKVTEAESNAVRVAKSAPALW